MYAHTCAHTRSSSDSRSGRSLPALPLSIRYRTVPSSASRWTTRANSPAGTRPQRSSPSWARRRPDDRRRAGARAREAEVSRPCAPADQGHAKVRASETLGSLARQPYQDDGGAAARARFAGWSRAPSGRCRGSHRDRGPGWPARAWITVRVCRSDHGSLARLCQRRAARAERAHACCPAGQRGAWSSTGLCRPARIRARPGAASPAASDAHVDRPAVAAMAAVRRGPGWSPTTVRQPCGTAADQVRLGRRRPASAAAHEDRAPRPAGHRKIRV